jgi:phage shock protein C
MRKLLRSVTDSKLTGLCGGIAEYTGFSATLLRLLLVILTFTTGGTALLFYFAAALIVPKETMHNGY